MSVADVTKMARSSDMTPRRIVYAKINYLTQYTILNYS